MSNTLFIDTETTGLPITRKFNDYYPPENNYYYENSRLIEIAYIIYDENKNIVKEVNNLIKPDNFIITNQYIHGISNDNALENGKDISEVLDELNNDLNNIDIIVAHNINFDINIILSECYRKNKIELIDKLKSIEKECTMEIGKHYMKTYRSPKLVILYEHLFHKSVDQIHRALSDTQICAECYYKMLENVKIV